MAYNITKLNSTSTIKKILYIVVIIVCLLVINTLARSIYDLWKKQDLLVKAKTDLLKAQEENQELKTQLSYVKSDEFIEEEARNKLFMVKEGETSVIVPKNLIEEKEVKKEVVLPVWQQWIKLFIEGR